MKLLVDDSVNRTCSPQRMKRRLHLEIARNRRRTSAALADSLQELRELARWQTYVKRFPAQSLAAAFGFGWLIAGAVRRSSWSGWIGRMAMRAAADSVWASLRSGMIAAWTQPKSGNS